MNGPISLHEYQLIQSLGGLWLSICLSSGAKEEP